SDLVDMFPLKITIMGSTSSVTVMSQANISEENEVLSAQGGFNITGVEGQPINNATVATFKTDGSEPASAFSATINWGDGTTSTGTISGPSGGVFTVTGSHTYANTGQFTISVTITHETAPPVTVTDTVNLAPNVTVNVAGNFTLFGVENTAVNNAT